MKFEACGVLHQDSACILCCCLSFSFLFFEDSNAKRNQSETTITEMEHHVQCWKTHYAIVICIFFEVMGCIHLVEHARDNFWGAPRYLTSLSSHHPRVKPCLFAFITTPTTPHPTSVKQQNVVSSWPILGRRKG